MQYSAKYLLVSGRSVMRLAFLIAMLIAASHNFHAENITVDPYNEWVYPSPPPYLKTISFLDTVVIGETRYLRFVQWDDDFFRENVIDTVCVREEDRRIYRYMEQPIDSVHGKGEYLLYDFNLKTGDRYEALTFNYDQSTKTFNPNVTVLEISSSVSCGYYELDSHFSMLPLDMRLQRQTVRNLNLPEETEYEIYEAIGPTYGNTIFCPVYDGVSPSYLWYMRRLSPDSENYNIWYHWELAGIKDLKLDQAAENAIYSISGIPLTAEPAKGIFIKGGRKIRK